MATRAQNRDDILSIFYRHDPALADLPVELAATSNGTTTTIVDTALGRGTSQSSRYDGRRVEIVEAAHAAIGEVAGVDNGGFNGTSTLTLSPAFGTLLSSGQDYRIYPKGLSPDLVYREINNVIRNTEVPHLWVPSLVPDADFDSATTSNWAAVGTPATRAFDASAAQALLGERTLHLVADAADEGATSNTFRVTEDENLLVSVFVRADIGTANVILRRITATAADVRTVSIDEEDWTEVRFTEVVPTGMEEAAIRLLCSANLDDIYISSPVTVQSLWERVYVAPSWLTEPDRQIDHAVLLRQGYASEVADAYVALSRRFEDYPRPDFIRADRWLNRNHVQFKGSSFGPVGLWCYRTFAELTADTSTTNLDRQYIAHKVAANLTRSSSNVEWQIIHERASAIAREVARARGYGKKGVRIEQPMRMY